MAYLGLKEDGLYTMATEENTFIKHYEKNWDELMADVYYKTALLSFGHKFRPRLVYWGYRAAKVENLTDYDYNAVSKVAISIELVHKASTLIDDYIDDDTARHGMPSFHVTYGPERTMIYSLNILCRALRIINNVFSSYISDALYSNISMKLVIQTLEDMTLGVLKELDLNENISVQKLAEIQEIMHLETASLITNSLLVGYLLSQNTDIKVIEHLTEIGKDLGYIFQILNDLEPFCSKKNNEHKGSINTDISRNRKNISVPVLYVYLNAKEKRAINNSQNEARDELLLSLFTKYDIKQKLFDEITNANERIHKNIESISKDLLPTSWRHDFHCFVDSVILVSQARLQ